MSSLTLFLPIILLLGLVVLLAGALIALFFYSRRKPGPTPAGLVEKSGEAPVLPPDRFAHLGSLYRDRRTGELVVERQSHPYRSVDALAGSERKEIETAAHDLLAWLELVPTKAPVEPPVEPVPPPTPTVLSVNPAIALGEPVVTRRPAAVSIVAQIDEILQEMLVTSAYAGRDIHLSERPECGVLVWIGAQRYEGVDSVPEGEVKSILRAAVQEWERRQAG